MESSYGVDENGKPVLFDFLWTAHTALGGSTRSGKSVCSYRILSAAAYMPGVRVCGIDPSGILLDPHRRGEDDPLIHLGTADPESAVAVIERLVKLMDARIKLILSKGLDQVPAAAVSADFPTYLVVLEEWPATQAWLEGEDRKRKADERVLPRLLSAVGRLLREAAKARILVFTIVQKAEASTLPGRSQYSRRISFRTDNTSSVQMLFEIADSEMVEKVMAFKPGQGLLHEAGDQPRFFKADRIEYADYRALVENARQRDYSAKRSEAERGSTLVT